MSAWCVLGQAAYSVQAHHFGRYNLVVEKLEARLIIELSRIKGTFKIIESNH